MLTTYRLASLKLKKEKKKDFLFRLKIQVIVKLRLIQY